MKRIILGLALLSLPAFVQAEDTKPQIDITKWSETELKATAYDLVNLISLYQNNLKAINEELTRRLNEQKNKSKVKEKK